MPQDPHFTESLKQQYVALILRLTLDEHNHLLYGVALDIDDLPVGKFRNGQELVALLHRWLKKRRSRSAE